jgi:hypothetical protein
MDERPSAVWGMGYTPHARVNRRRQRREAAFVQLALHAPPSRHGDAQAEQFD